jgi:hypothetical protein
VARLLTCGFEAGAVQAETSEFGGLACYQGGVLQATTPAGFAYSSSTVRSGAGSLNLVGYTGGAASFIQSAAGVTIASAVTYYFRVAVYPVTLPTSDDLLLFAFNGGASAGGVQLALNASGILEVQNTSNSVTQYTAGILPLNTWTVVEMSYVATTGATSLRANGTLIGSGTVQTISAGTTAVLGIYTPSTTCSVFLDDYAINDSTGTAQNTWCGPGRIVMIQPAATFANVGFTGGKGSTVSSIFWQLINFYPPAGDRQNNSFDQLQDPTSNTTDYFEATMQSFAAAGIPTGSNVALVKAHVVHSNSTTTSRTNGVSVLSNPVIAEATGTTGTVAATTYPTGWTTLDTVYSYAPVVPPTTGAVVKFRKGTASTDYSMICQMGMIAEFVPPPNAPSRPRQAVMRAIIR